MDEKIRTRVPLEFTGEAPAVKEKGGVLNKTLLEIEIEALPGDLPRHVEVRLETLDDVNKSIYVKDLALPKSVKVFLDAETVVVSVMPPRAEEEVVKVEAPADVSAVKVETEEKKAERAAEKSEKETE